MSPREFSLAKLLKSHKCAWLRGHINPRKTMPGRKGRIENNDYQLVDISK